MAATEMYGLSDTGIRRRHNEDCVKTIPARGIAVLADGMGGHQAGEVASAMAAEQIIRHLQQATPSPEAPAAELLRQAVMASNSEVFRTAGQRPECAGMATTIVAALFHEDKLCIAHIGDSRMYRLRDGILTHMTEDHSLVQEQLRLGLLTADDAHRASNRNLVTRALGIEAEVKPDLIETGSRPDDLYLLCSDGLTGVVPDEAIRLILIEYGESLQRTATELVAMANDAGGPDNISVILVRTGHATKQAGRWSRLLGRHQ
ncbi:MAG TPA: Stp1/IreP family PP2C-type Ser/Thr phosphatase [Mariprofundaceae bacterium]|nr:Stp1/IreP family PP2C-type Ser/Thr phosphatase [Mariprofundaceae bacterium]